jgi:hypothetical protein
MLSGAYVPLHVRTVAQEMPPILQFISLLYIFIKLVSFAINVLYLIFSLLGSDGMEKKSSVVMVSEEKTIMSYFRLSVLCS